MRGHVVPFRLGMALATLLATPGVVGAQVTWGPEFQVNSYLPGTQRFRSVTGIPGWVFVVTWDSDGQDGSQYGVFARRYHGGTPLTGEFRVNTHTTGNQRFSRAASDQANGPFLIVWQSQDQDGDGEGIFAQRYLPWGPPAGGEFRVNTFTPLDQGAADAVFTGGNFVVVWQSDGQDGSSYGIFGQRYDGAGVPLGSEFRVNTYTTGPQRAPRIASDSSGTFVVVWEGYSADDQALGIRGQRYSSGGVPLGGEFRINSYTTGNQRSPAVDTILVGSQTVVVWESDGQDGSGRGVFGQRYDAAWVPLGSEFRANSYTTSDQSSPDVTFAATGFMVVWQSDLQDGSSTGIYMQKFSSGIPLGEFRVNSYTNGPQTGPEWAFAGWPAWLSPWSSAQDPDGSLGVYAQPWTDLPVELQTFTVQ